MSGVQIQEIAKLLTKEVELMNSFVSVLQKEEQILSDNQAEKLEQIIGEKNLVLNDILVIEKQKNQLLTQLGFAIDAEGMNAFLAKTSGERSIHESWKQLLELSAQAKECNRVNGLLINRQMVKNQTALNILQQTDQNAAVYGADGQSKTTSSSGRGFIAG